MNLKSFHLFFIAVSLLLAVAVGGWGVWSFVVEGRAGSLILAFVFLGAAVLLAVYGVRFRRKFRDLGAD